MDSQWYLRYYNEELTEFTSVPSEAEEALKYPEDGFLDHGIVEMRLRKLARLSDS